MYSRLLRIGCNVVRVPPDSVPLVSLLSAPSARFDHRHKGASFCRFAPGPRKSLDGPDYIQIDDRNTHSAPRSVPL